MNDPNLIKMNHDCDETGSWKHPKPDEECFPSCFTAVLPRLMKDGKDRSDRRENMRQLWVSASAFWDAIRKSEQWEVFAVDYGLI